MQFIPNYVIWDFLKYNKNHLGICRVLSRAATSRFK